MKSAPIAIHDRPYVSSGRMGRAIIKAQNGKGWEDLLAELDLPKDDEFWVKWARTVVFRFGGKRDA